MLNPDFVTSNTGSICMDFFKCRGCVKMINVTELRKTSAQLMQFYRTNAPAEQNLVEKP